MEGSAHICRMPKAAIKKPLRGKWLLKSGAIFSSSLRGPYAVFAGTPFFLGTAWLTDPQGLYAQAPSSVGAPLRARTGKHERNQRAGCPRSQNICPLCRSLCPFGKGWAEVGGRRRWREAPGEGCSRAKHNASPCHQGPPGLMGFIRTPTKKPSLRAPQARGNRFHLSILAAFGKNAPPPQGEGIQELPSPSLLFPS
jgi:hypothetical protein